MDNFFDVWTEISFDGGETWSIDHDPSHDAGSGYRPSDGKVYLRNSNTPG